MAQHWKPAALAAAIALAVLPTLAPAEAVSSKLQINGFATAGASWMTDDYDTVYFGDPFDAGPGITEDGNFTDDNVLGVQLAYAVDDRIDLVGQLVAKGREDYQTDVDWSYVAYKMNDNFRFRAGRFAAPFFVHSENRSVGQAYPWARLPVELYGGVPVDSIDGFDVLYRQSLGSLNLDAQLSAGGSHDTNINLKRTVGLNFTLSGEALSLRAGYMGGNLSLSLGKNPFGSRTEQLGYLMSAYGVDLDTKETAASFTDLGATYDDGKWLVMAEFGQLRLERYLSDQDAGYLTVGHYFGKWLPYVMFAKSNTVKGDECQADLAPAQANANAAVLATVPLSPEYFAAVAAAQAVGGAIFLSCAGAEQTSYSAGVRYDATKQVSVKLEVDHVQDFHNSPGYFQGVVLSDDDTTDVITFNVNAAF